MEAGRFDALSRSLASTTRRGAARLLVGGALGLLSRERAGATHSGCRHDGKPCKRHGQCCSAKCSRKGRCTCPGGTTKCGKTACCRTADEQCCTDTCAPATLVPEGGTCASGSSGECCTGLICTYGDQKCCRRANVCFKTCCPEGTLCTTDQATGFEVCCASGNSCNGVCCRRADDRCTDGDLACCRPENVCNGKFCCNPLNERCDDLNCVPIIGPIIGT